MSIRLFMILIGTFLLLFTGPITAAYADKLCPLLVVGRGDTCWCVVQNYDAHKTDTGVTITLTGYIGIYQTTGPLSILPQSSIFIKQSIDSDSAICGCRVTGDASTSRTSLSAVDSSGQLLATVHCY